MINPERIKEVLVEIVEAQGKNRRRELVAVLRELLRSVLENGE